MPDRNSRPARPAFAAASGDETVERTRADANHPVRDGDASESAAEADRNAGNAAVAYQKVRAGADHRDRDFRRQRRQKGGEILGVGRAEQDFGGTADAEPSLLADRRIHGQPAADRGKPLRSEAA